VRALQCPARIFLARHGEAAYETDLVTEDGGSLTALGRRQARDLGERLRSERIARVWCSPLSRAVQTAELAAGVLGVDVVVHEGSLDEVADAHPGEAVLVVSHGGAILASAPGLTGRPRLSSYDVVLPATGFVELEADADGWRVVRWDAAGA
jgi:broad specificity phosphatase PhoE